MGIIHRRLAERSAIATINLSGIGDEAALKFARVQDAGHEFGSPMDWSKRLHVRFEKPFFVKRWLSVGSHKAAVISATPSQRCQASALAPGCAT